MRKPKDEELYGVILQELGAKRFRVMCSDGNLRMCNSKNRVRYVKKNKVVLLTPWSIQGDEKGRITYCFNKYKSNQIINDMFRGIDIY